MSKRLNLTGFTIMVDPDTLQRKELTRSFTPNELAQLLIPEWIPYYECGKCGRSDYCKYTQPYAANPSVMRDIKCGVAVDVVRNLVQSTFHLLDGARRERIQKYLDGAFHLCQFVYDAEQVIGMCMNTEIIEWFAEYAPAAFGRLVHLRRQLNSAGSVLRHIDAFHTQQAVLFVEGQSERAFLHKLRESRLGWFLFTEVEDYGGSGNRRAKRAEMLLDKYVRQGYRIYIEGDADGKNGEIFRSLVNKGSLRCDHTFVFDYDFESAVPADLLLAALQHLGHLEDVPVDDFVERVCSTEISVVSLIRDEYRLDIDAVKVDLAVVLAEMLNGPLSEWWEDACFMCTELGRFLHFIQRIG